MFKPKPPLPPWSRDFREVLSDELDRIGDKDGDGKDPIARAHAKQLVGLAFSGGGIRSATFNLGILQSLARMKVLSKFDYLSTVSGGGYIGGWLMAWMSRRGVEDVWAGLRPERKRQPGATEPEEIHFLRRFSNYLTPKLGWLGADTWTVIAIYIRNLILNFLMLGSAMVVVLLLPRWVAIGSAAFWQRTPSWILGIVAGACLSFATYAIVRSMKYFAAAADSATMRPPARGNLENESGWRDKDGKDVPPAVLARRDMPPSWYFDDLFDDFILKLEFKICGSTEGAVYVWTPKLLDEDVAQPRPDLSSLHKIYVSSPANKRAQTGAIDAWEPTRRARLDQEWNELEIVCVRNVCTVRANKLTLNSRRIAYPSTGPFSEIGGPCRPPAAIGLDKGGGSVDFRCVSATKIESPASSGVTQGQVQRRIIFPLFLAAFSATFLFGYIREAGYPLPRWMGSLVLPNLPTATPWPWWVCALAAGTISAALVFAVRVVLARLRKQSSEKQLPDIWRESLSIGLAAGVGGILALALYHVFREKTLWQVTVWGTPALIAVFLVTIALDIGFLGRRLPDQRREWWGRLNAWLLIYALAWVAIFGIAFYAPILLERLRSGMQWALNALSVAWIVSTVSGLLAARGATTGRERSNQIVDIIAKVGPYVFVIGFFILLSCAVDTVLHQTKTKPDSHGVTVSDLARQHWETMDDANHWWPLFLLTAGAAATAAVFSWRLDINQFSLHMLYRNRLGRCYLGASNSLRRAQSFTGFSADDDMPLTKLADLQFKGRFAAPFPIINAALNLVGGKELAWQQRKAASFVFTPYHCGYEFPELPPGYCKTEDFAKLPSPVSLATAMAISGAAASPNMGYHTSPAPAFLMTVFNVRLGWWLGNPRKQSGYQRSGPLNVLSSLVCELFGLTSEEGKYIYLSDGGHFENLGIYELVRRRCRFIVACDAEEDHMFGFGGLGNAIEKCRSDFGIDIDIDVEPVRRLSEKGHSEWHCAIGKIFYSRVDRNARDGVLVYIKSSLTGDEPTDVLRYAAANPGFPHQSTGDQWFDESQFESYRVLGFHVAENVFGAVGDPAKLEALPKEQLFVDLAKQWYPPSAATAESFTKHTRSIVAIYDELRENKNLAFLSEYVYPEWRVLFDKRKRFWSPPSSFAVDTRRPLRDQLPTSEAELRAGFYICNSVFQLFEDAYVDLQLEKEFAHPDNRGWMNFFKHWSWAPMLRVAWTISAGNYGARFQSFCERHLDLKIGETKVRPVDLGPEIDLSVSNEPYEWTAEIGGVAEKIGQAIWTWLGELAVGSDVTAAAALVASLEAPQSQIDSAISGEKALEEAKRLIAEALEGRKDAQIPEYVPNGADEEWYVAATLLDMCQRRGVDEDVKRTWADKVAAMVLSHAAIIAERVFCGDFQEEFNPVERELVELFFIFNPSLAPSARLVRLEVTPDPHAPDASSRNRNLHFPFGFAILARTDLPQQSGGRHKLVYFRVQDHLRRMGLARHALERMNMSDTSLETDLKKMHPAAYEVPSEKDRDRFLRMCASVNTAVRQKLAVRHAAPE